MKDFTYAENTLRNLQELRSRKAVITPPNPTPTHVFHANCRDTCTWVKLRGRECEVYQHTPPATSPSDTTTTATSLRWETKASDATMKPPENARQAHPSRGLCVRRFDGISVLHLSSVHKHLDSIVLIFFSLTPPLSPHTRGQIEESGTTVSSAAISLLTKIALLLTQYRVRQI